MGASFRVLPYSFLALLFTWTLAHNIDPRSLTALSDTDIVSLGTTPNPSKHLDPYDPHSHLYKILIPRPPGTENNTVVRNHIVRTLRSLNWHVEEDEFRDSTPYGEKRFANVIATKDPEAPRRIILSAHFDSKFFPSPPMNQFLGATDSAAACAVLLDLAESLNPMLDARIRRIKHSEADEEELEAAETTVQLVFFDGEEAFKDWTEKDSVYGARHLAERWSSEFVLPLQPRKLNRVMTQLDAIEHLVLLDLLGAENPIVQSYYSSTAWLFDGLVAAEHRLGLLGLFNEAPASNAEGGEWHTWSSFFKPRTSFDHMWGGIQDDHVPFVKRGVNILHVIANPFPRVWHSLKDDASAIHIPTLKRWNLIFRIFTVEYLKLKPSSITSQKRAVGDELSRTIPLV